MPLSEKRKADDVKNETASNAVDEEMAAGAYQADDGLADIPPLTLSLDPVEEEPVHAAAEDFGQLDAMPEAQVQSPVAPEAYSQAAPIPAASAAAPAAPVQPEAYSQAAPMSEASVRTSVSQEALIQQPAASVQGIPATDILYDAQGNPQMRILYDSNGNPVYVPLQK